MTRPAEAEQSEEEKVVTLRLFGSLDMGHCPLLAHVTQSLYALQHLHIVAVVEAVGETQPVAPFPPAPETTLGLSKLLKTRMGKQCFNTYLQSPPTTFATFQ